jgi:hypothetical protein
VLVRVHLALAELALHPLNPSLTIMGKSALSEYIKLPRSIRIAHIDPSSPCEYRNDDVTRQSSKNSARKVMLEYLHIDNDIEKWRKSGVNTGHYCSGNQTNPRGVCQNPLHLYPCTSKENGSDRWDNFFREYERPIEVVQYLETVGKSGKRVLSVEECQTIVGAFKGTKYEVLFDLMLSEGLKVSEVMKVRWQDLENLSLSYSGHKAVDDWRLAWANERRVDPAPQNPVFAGQDSESSPIRRQTIHRALLSPLIRNSLGKLDTHTLTRSGRVHKAMKQLTRLAASKHL